MNEALPAGAARPLTLAVGEAGKVSALWLGPAQARACYVFAHGAGAGMTHPSMAAFAEGLAAREVATLRFQFLYMEKGSKRPDPPARSGPRSMKRRGSAAACPSSPAAARSVAG